MKKSRMLGAVCACLFTFVVLSVITLIDVVMFKLFDGFECE